MAMTDPFEQEAERVAKQLREFCGLPANSLGQNVTNAEWIRLNADVIAQALRAAVENDRKKWNDRVHLTVKEIKADGFTEGFSAGVEAAAKVAEGPKAYTLDHVQCADDTGANIATWIRALQPPEKTGE